MYSKDGIYPMDNNLAERPVRPIALSRKAMQYYTSEAGAEMEQSIWA